MNELFLDASFSIAVCVPSDQYHGQALEIAEAMEKRSFVTTRAVLLEIGNSLSKARYRESAVEVLEALERDPQIEIVALDQTLYQQAFKLYRRHADQEWGLTDCISFVVMRERGIWEALTADRHFEQAGFRALLLH